MTVTITNKEKELTQTHVAKIFGISDSDASRWFSPLKEAMDKKGINKVYRMAGFLATIGVESGNLKKLEENLNYSADRLLEVFPKYFKTREQAQQYAGNPKAIANKVYGSRMGNGNEASGDGYTYRGRGLIQITGKQNYAQLQRTGTQALSDPDFLTTDAGAVGSATWFWQSKGCNSFADRSDVMEMRRRVNGGLNGLDEFQSLYDHALIVLADEEVPEDAEVKSDPTDETEDKDNTVKTEAPDTDASFEPTPPSNHSRIVEPIAGGKAQYPWNRVYQSRAGHVIEIDDTPDRERLHWYHRTGTYAEMHPDGKYVLKSVHERHDYCDKDRFHQTGGDYTSKVSGQSYEKVGESKVLSVGSKVTIEAPDGVQVNTPRANFSNDVVAKFIQSDMFKQTKGVAQLMANRAVWSMKAGSLGPMPPMGLGSPKMGMPNPLWNGGYRYNYAGTQVDKTGVEFDYNSYEVRLKGNHVSHAEGSKEEVVDGDWLESNGGERHITAKKFITLTNMRWMSFKAARSTEIPPPQPGEGILFLDADDGLLKIKYNGAVKALNGETK